MVRFGVLILLIGLVEAARLCFDKSSNKSLFARPLLSLRGLNEEKCFNACLEMPRMACKSITYSKKSQVCQLNGKSKNEVKIVKNPMSDFYHRTCFERTSATFRRDAAAIESACFTVVQGKVLIGIVDQLVRDVKSVEDCQQHCTTAQTKFEITCKSAMFYEKDKECILASQAKSDIPDLYIDDDKSVYLENKCMESVDEEQKVVVKPSDVFKASSKFDEEVDIFPSSASKTTLSTILQTTTMSNSPSLEFSGYDGPSESVNNVKQEDILTEPPTSTTTTTTTTTTTPKPVNAKVIDTYNVVNNEKSEYGRRLRDTRIKSCFREVRPIGKMEALRVVKSYSLEQCTDMCRICTKCLVQHKKCQAVAFDISRELCVLASKRLTDGGSFKDDIIYHNRVSC